MSDYNEKELLAKRLKGQRLVIPDMHPIFAHWPSGQHEDYQAVKEMVEKRLDTQSMTDGARQTFNYMDPALCAATWWPTSSKDHYRVLVDYVTWFLYWDDLVEGLAHDPSAAENLRNETKTLVRRSLGLGGLGEKMTIANPLILGIKDIAKEVCSFYDEEQRKTLLGHFDRYIDSTKLEAEADLSDKLPSLKKYWEVRILTSGMGTLLGVTEYAAHAKMPSRLVSSAAYETLWVTTIVINSIVNDLISFKKEMKAGSVLSSVAILYQQVDNLDAAVQMSLAHLRILVDEFDRTATTILSKFSLQPDEVESVSKVINALRMVNTGNLEWSLRAKRYGVGPFTNPNGQIELIL
ncbi:terpenoid synthase [Hypoxylon sp. NC0597]|nr:terpenoid synthase [Hypoxylon sp. NC0597]